MYNGIGLQTARGSGTSGYVQKNLSTVNRSHKKHDFPTEQDIQKMEAALNKPPNQELLTHQKKRQIELKCLEERERLESQGYDEDAIERRLMEYRGELKIKAEEIAKIKEPTPKSELFKSASSTRNRSSPTRTRRSTSRTKTPPPPDNKPAVVNKELPRDDRSSPTTKIDSSPKYSIVHSRIRRASSSESPSPSRDRHRSKSRERKSRKSRRKLPKSRRSTSRNDRSRSREKKTKSRRRTSRSRRQRSRSKSSRSKSGSGRSRTRDSRSRSRSSKSRSRDSAEKSRKSDSKTRKRKVSPNFRESRRITSARKRPTPYQRYTSSDSESDEVSCYRYRLNGSSPIHWSGKYTNSPTSSTDSM